MRSESSPAELIERIEAEDLARARWYSFFSRWFLAPPDQQALELYIPADAVVARATVVSSPTSQFRSVISDSSPPGAFEAASIPGATASSASPDSVLESGWHAFAAAAACQPLDGMRAAYDDTFLAVGEAPVSLHASFYLTGFSNERPLAEVRQWLAGQGIEGSQSGLLTEDHLGLLCEAMAWLIIGQGDDSGREAASRAAADTSQQYLFQRFIAPVCDEFCQRLRDAPSAGVYRELGELFAAFAAVERQAFDIER